MREPTVLVLHDDAEFAAALCDLLVVYGVRAVAGRASTVDAVAAVAPAAVLLDMPPSRRADVRSLLATIRRDDRTAHVPVLLMGRPGDEHDDVAALPSVAVATRPLGGLQIVSSVTSLLGQSTATAGG